MVKQANVVIYVEGMNQNYNEEIIISYTDINKRYLRSADKFFVPIYQLHQIKDILIKEFESSIKYYCPRLTENGLKSKNQILTDMFLIWQTITDLNPGIFPQSPTPYLLDLSDTSNISYFSGDDSFDLLGWIHRFAEPNQKVYEDLADFRPLEDNDYDPDEDEKYQSVSWEIKSRITELADVRAYKLLAETFLFMAKEVGLDQTKTEQLIYSSRLLDLPGSNSEDQLSRLLIDSNYRVFLVDYNNIEVKMPTLSKVIFIFFLRHINGILFKEISNHRLEIHNIYYKITKRTDSETLFKSLKDLVDPTSNSLNEKCSRIKDAFVSVIGDNVAKYYYVTGERGRPKSIKLPRELVTFEND